MAGIRLLNRDKLIEVAPSARAVSHADYPFKTTRRNASVLIGENNGIISLCTSGESVGQFWLALAVFMSMFKVSLRNWFDPNWRQELTNALIIASVLAIFGVLGTAVYSFMTKTHPPLYAFLVGGAIIGLSIGFIVYLLISNSANETSNRADATIAHKNANSAKSVPISSETVISALPPKLRDLYQTDFSHCLKFSNEGEIHAKADDGNIVKTKIAYSVNMDFAAKSRFISIYVASSPASFHVCKEMPNFYPEILKESETIDVTSQSPLDHASENSKELTFTGKIYVYHEDGFSLEQLGSLEALFKGKNLLPQFRGSQYAVKYWLEKKARATPQSEAQPQAQVVPQVPTIGTACGSDILGCRPTNAWVSGLVRFLRIAVNSEWPNAPLTKCQARLISICLDGVPQWGGDTAVLTFAPGEDDDATAKTLYHGQTEYVDVIAIASDGQLFPGTKDRQWRFMPRLTDIFSKYGEFVLTVVIVGDMIQTHTTNLKFTWTGDHDTSALEKIALPS